MSFSDCNEGLWVHCKWQVYTLVRDHRLIEIDITGADFHIEVELLNAGSIENVVVRLISDERKFEWDLSYRTFETGLLAR